MMKNWLFTLGVCVALSLTSSLSAIELVGNGGFETGDFTDWQQFPQGWNPNGHDGQSSFVGFGRLTSTRRPPVHPSTTLIKSANRGIGQISAGQSVIISFDARGATGNGGVAFAEFFSEIDGGGVSDSVNFSVVLPWRWMPTRIPGQATRTR